MHRSQVRLAFTRYCFTSKLNCGSQSSVCCHPQLQGLPYCSTIVRPLRNICPPPPPPSHIIPYEILVMAISCNGQRPEGEGITYVSPKTFGVRTRAPYLHMLPCRARKGRRLAFTRYCHTQYCIVPGTQAGGWGRAIRCAILCVNIIQGGAK